MAENSHKECLNRLMDTPSTNLSNLDSRPAPSSSALPLPPPPPPPPPSHPPPLPPATAGLSHPASSGATGGSVVISAGAVNSGGNNPSGYLGTNAQICCLVEEGTRCNRLAGNASCSKRIQRTIVQRKLRLAIDTTARHIYICDHHKNIIQSMRSITKRKRKEEEEENNSNDEYSFHGSGNVGLNCSSYGDGYEDGRGTAAVAEGAGVGGNGPNVDLSSLQLNTLRRYKRYYRISAKPSLNKSQLTETLESHFHTIPVFEKEVITYFIYMIKTNRNKLDQVKPINAAN